MSKQYIPREIFISCEIMQTYIYIEISLIFTIFFNQKILGKK